LNDHPNEPDDIRDQANEKRHIGQRLREAREYLGLSQEQVAEFLSIPRASVSEMEGGKRGVNGLELRRLGRLYRRSVAWLLGEDEAVAIDGALFRATASLSDQDKAQVVKFAEFLAGAGSPNRAQTNRSRQSRSKNG
jgi:transcriptional regulator with XRE-family HTH domain